MDPAARRIVELIDLTDLDDRCDAAAVAALCSRAAAAGTAAVCVWPEFVGRAARALTTTEVRVATVVNFPTGDERPHAVALLTAAAVADGADEIDVVLPYRAFVASDTNWVARVLDDTRAAAGAAQLKVILETGELPDAAHVTAATRLAIEHGADFVKTSTGKSAVSATTAAVSAMLDVIAEHDGRVGIKPSGGIRTVAQAAEYLALADARLGAGWATPATFRFGASGLLDALVD